MKNKLYFAYGVNMNLEKMAAYCPGAVFLGPAQIAYHALVFDGQSLRRPGATANIKEDLHGTLWGALFAIDAKDLAALDAFENYPISYQRKLVSVYDARGWIRFDVVVYFRTGEKEGKPGTSYFEDLLNGAKSVGLPPAYLENLLKTECL